MKKSSLLMIAAAILLSSCRTSVQLGSSSNDARFQDGIYSSTPSFRSREERVVSQNKTDALVEETKASRVYLFGEKKDSVIIPQNMSATIKYDKAIGSTVVTVGENPYDWQNNINPWTYYTPYSIGSSCTGADTMTHGITTHGHTAHGDMEAGTTHGTTAHMDITDIMDHTGVITTTTADGMEDGTRIGITIIMDTTTEVS